LPSLVFLQSVDGEIVARSSTCWRSTTVMFGFANAPMLHLVGQKLALANAGKETAFMSACVIAAQIVMLPMLVLVGRKADTWGRKPICLAALMCCRCAACFTQSPTTRPQGLRTYRSRHLVRWSIDPELV
jgi:hypothetical protein